MIELKNLCAGYGREDILHGISASFAAGRLTSIIGPNGSGKSTLLKVMLGLLPPGKGEVLIGGESIVRLSRSEIAARAAYLAQGKGSADMTVGQLVLHGRFPHLSYPRIYKENDRRTARAAMEQMGIAALAEKPISTLSGGTRQRAYIAMALAQDTEYILLDEPAAYLDITHQLELMRLLRSLADSGRGIVIVMHDLPLALSFSDEIALIHEGRLAEKAPPADITGIADIFGVAVGKTSEGGWCYRY